MNIDNDKVDDAVLALLFLTTHEGYGAVRAWKGYPWESLDRLHEKGFIDDPRSKNKSVILTNQGEQRSRELFQKLFTRPT